MIISEETKKIIEEGLKTDVQVLLAAKEKLKQRLLDEPTPQTITAFAKISSCLRDLLEEDEKRKSQEDEFPFSL